MSEVEKPKQARFAELLAELESGIKERLAQEEPGWRIFDEYVLPHDAINVGLSYYARHMLRLIGKEGDDCLANELRMDAQSVLWRYFRKRDFGEYYMEKIVKFRSWLISALRNACREVLRRRHREKTRQDKMGVVFEQLVDDAFLDDPQQDWLEREMGEWKVVEIQKVLNKVIRTFSGNAVTCHAPPGNPGCIWK